MLSTEEITQLTELAKKFEPANTDAVHSIVQTHFHPVFQRINDGGRAAANADNKAKLEEKENLVRTTQGLLDKAKEDLKLLTEKTPEVAVLRREYEEKIRGLEATHKTQLEERDRLVVQGHQDRAVSDFVSTITTLGVDAEYARTVLASRADIKSRIRVKDGKVEVLQAGQQELTITPAANKTSIDHLAEEVFGTVGDKWKVSKISGRGPKTDASGNLPNGTNKFDAIREAEKSRAKESEKKDQRPALARLRGE